MHFPPLSVGRFAWIASFLFLASSIAVRVSGLVVSLPWNLITLVCVIAVPFSVCLHQLSRLERVNSPLAKGLSLGACLVILFGWQYALLWPLMALVLWLTRGTIKLGLRNGRLLLYGAVALISSYGVVWNLNYLMVRHMPANRWDPLIHSMDLAFYDLLFGRRLEFVGLFPMVHNPWLLVLFDNAYAVLMSEIILVLFLLSQESSDWPLLKFLQRLFGFYGIAILIYLCFPVNGPHLYYPDHVDLKRSLPGTVAIAGGMLHDFQISKAGGLLRGFGYFIAVPSLHVLVALFLQHCLYPFALLFRIFLPVNIAVCLSTVILGYHYIFDVVAAIAVYILSVVIGGQLGALPSHRIGGAQSSTQPQ